MGLLQRRGIYACGVRWMHTLINERYSKQTKDSRPLKLPEIDSKFIPKQSRFPSKLPLGLSADPESTINAYLGAYAIRSLAMHSYPQEKYSLPPTSLSEYGWAWDKKQLKPFGQDLNRPEQKVGYYSLEDRFQERRGLQSVHKWWGGGPESFMKFDRSFSKGDKKSQTGNNKVRQHLSLIN